MNNFKPFDNDSQALTIKGANGSQLTMENGLDEIIIYGDLSINKDSDPNAINGLIEALRNIQNTLNNTDSSSLKSPKNK